jgi:hypothetical protein
MNNKTNQEIKTVQTKKINRTIKLTSLSRKKMTRNQKKKKKTAVKQLKIKGMISEKNSRENIKRAARTKKTKNEMLAIKLNKKTNPILMSGLRNQKVAINKTIKSSKDRLLN